MNETELYFKANTISQDLFGLIAGKMLGAGIGREVFECKLDPTIVLKFESTSHSFQNIGEWRFWDESQHCKDIARWLAPCVSISACGTILVQKRIDPIKKLPPLLPAFLTDRKAENFGMPNGRIVACDYGNVITSVSTRLKK